MIYAIPIELLTAWPQINIFLIYLLLLAIGQEVHELSNCVPKLHSVPPVPSLLDVYFETSSLTFSSQGGVLLKCIDNEVPTHDAVSMKWGNQCRKLSTVPDTWHQFSKTTVVVTMLFLLLISETPLSQMRNVHLRFALPGSELWVPLLN